MASLGDKLFISIAGATNEPELASECTKWLQLKANGAAQRRPILEVLGFPAAESVCSWATSTGLLAIRLPFQHSITAGAVVSVASGASIRTSSQELVSFEGNATLSDLPTTEPTVRLTYFHALRLLNLYCTEFER